MGDIAVNVIDSRQQGGDSSFFDSNIYTPPANRMVYIVNYTVQIAVSPVLTPVVSGNGLAWALVFHQTFDHAGTDRGSLTVHRGFGASPTSARTRITYLASQLRNAMTILEGVNVDTSFSGVNSVAQFKSGKIADVTTDTPGITLDNPASQSNNAVLGLVAWGDLIGNNPLMTNGVGFNILLQNSTVEGGGQAVEFRGPFQQLADWSSSSDAFAWGVAAMELKNAETPPDPDAPQVIGRPSFISGNLIT